jgi:branched-chain amino acid transport system substrate-binding protein
MSFSTSRRLGVAVVVSAALLAAGCGSSKKVATPATTTAAATTATTVAAATTAAPATTVAAATTTAAAPATTAAPADPLGAKTAAAGDPITIGYMWSGVSAAVDNSSDEQMAQATIKFLNDYRGGIAGHPIKLEICAGSDTATASACGDKMVAAKPAAVLFNVIGDVKPWASKVIEAKIPIIAYSSADASLLAPGLDVFTMSNPIAGLAVFPAAEAKKLGAKKNALSVINVPAAVGPATALAKPMFAAAGLEVNIVATAPDAADHTSAVQEALKQNPETWHIVGNPAYCTLDIKALRTAGFKGQISMISNCLDPSAIKTLGADLKGIKVDYVAGEDPTNPDNIEMLALAKKYGDPKLVPQGTAVGAYLVWSAFNRIMKGATDITPAGIVTRMRATDGTIVVPTMKGSVIKCDGKQVPGIAIACTNGYLIGVLDDKGGVASYSAP